MSVEVADLVAKLGLQAEAFHSGMAAAEARAKSGAGSIGSALSGIGHVALGAGLALSTGLAGGLAATIGPAMRFEQTMSGIKAVSGATAAQMSQLSGLALQLGKDTTFSAKAAGEGIEELIKGGVSIPDIMNGAAKATLNLAAAGGVDLPSAAEIAANALNMFSLHGADMAHVADLIAGAANASSLSVMDFKFSLSAVGAVAKTVGLSFDDTAVAISELGAAGIKGSDAGTSLKTMLLNLSPQTKKAAEEMRTLGLITKDGHNQFFDAAGHVRRLADVQQVLQTSLRGLADQQKLNALHTIFGTYAIKAAAVLAADGAAGFNSMAAAMGKVTAQSVAAERMNNLAGWIEQLKGSLETLAITIGMKLLPMLTNLAKGATDVVNSFIGWAEALPPGMLEWGLKLGAVAAAVLTFGGALALVLPALAPIGAILGALGLPLLAIGVAIGGLALAWSQNWGGIRKTVAGAWSSVGPLLAQFKGAATALFNVLTGKWSATNAGEGLAKPFAEAVNRIAGIFGAFRSGGLGAGLSKMMEEAKGLLGSLVGWMGTTALPAIGAAAVRWGGALLGWIAPKIPPLLAAAGNLLGRLAGWATGTALPALARAVAGWGGAFLGWIAPKIPPLLAAAGNLLLRLGGWIKDTALPDLLGKVGQWGGALVGWVAPRIPGLLAQLGGFLGRLGGWIAGTALPAVVRQLSLWGQALLNWVAPRIGPLLGQLGTLAGSVGAWLLREVPMMAGRVGQWGLAFVRWVAPALRDLLAHLRTLGTEVGAWVQNQIPRIRAKLDQWQGAFAAWVPGAWTKLKFAVAGFAKQLVQWMNTAAKTLEKNTDTWAQAFADWLVPAANKVTGKGGKADQFLQSMVKWMITDFGPSLYRLSQSIGDLIGQAIIDAAINAVKKVGIAGIVKLIPGAEPLLAASGWGKDKLAALGGNVGAGLGKGIADSTKHVVQATSDVGKKALAALRHDYGIKSPSTVMADVGHQAMAGLAKGITDGSAGVQTALSTSITKAVQKALTQFPKALSQPGVLGTVSTAVTDSLASGLAKVKDMHGELRTDAAQKMIDQTISRAVNAAIKKSAPGVSLTSDAWGDLHKALRLAIADAVSSGLTDGLKGATKAGSRSKTAADAWQAALRDGAKDQGPLVASAFGPLHGPSGLFNVHSGRAVSMARTAADQWQFAFADTMTKKQREADELFVASLKGHPAAALLGTGPLGRGFAPGGGAAHAPLVSGPPRGAGLGGGPLGSGGPVTVQVNIHPNAVNVQGGAGATTDHKQLAREMGNQVAASIVQTLSSAQKRALPGAARTLPGNR